MQPAPVAAAPVAAAAPAAALSRDKLAEMLLAIVEEKTGYPKDMVGLDQNLESDLGIDSIKRIEVVGAMLQALPEAWRAALVDSRSKLNTQPTLNGMLDLIGSAKEGAAVPFERAEAGTPVAGAVVADHAPSRHLIEPTPEALPETAARRLAAGRYLIVPDRGTLADGLATRLAERGATVERLDPALLGDEAALVAWCAT
ncbi:phosphopantetheine-binding protein, partial [Rubrivivax gelatinosus]|uniref:phosphopantetheine-binding protein n=1 Tax=Rubrivivax gelatinosus TaxID=28068 RepID=UPI001ED94B49